jgi:hypothetical protein
MRRAGERITGVKLGGVCVERGIAACLPTGSFLDIKGLVNVIKREVI